MQECLLNFYIYREKCAGTTDICAVHFSRCHPYGHNGHHLCAVYKYVSVILPNAVFILQIYKIITYLVQ